MSAHRRKALRSFYCEEELWQAFEKLAKDRDATVDRLLNDALRSFLSGGSQRPARVSASQPSAPPPRPRADPALSRSSPDLNDGPVTLQRVPAIKSDPRRAPAPPPGPPAAPPGPPVAPPAPARPPRRSGSPPAVNAGPPKLFLHFDGRSNPVDKERFVIGRGTKGTDLTIRDGNISRKHAAVILHGGQFYIQDLGSTNGVEYRGNRIDTKRIEEGDVFSICEYEFSFSFRN